VSTVDFPQVPRLVVTPAGFAGTGTQTFQVPDPAPGMDASDVWQIQAVTFRVVTDATVATRVPVVQVNAGDGLPIATAAAGYGITASSTADYGFVRGLSEWDQANNAFASGPAPLIPLDPGDSIVLQLAAGVAADAVSRIHIVLSPLHI
jgi:hypothetical protein